MIAENFGANATYVETLLARWQSDPALVDESWQTYFGELLGRNSGAVTLPQADGSGASTQKRDAQRDGKRDGAGAGTGFAPATTPQIEAPEKAPTKTEARV